MRVLKNLFEQNKKWAEKVKESEPDFFLKLSKQQNPEYLWIGCSDSRVPANQIVDMPDRNWQFMVGYIEHYVKRRYDY